VNGTNAATHLRQFREAQLDSFVFSLNDLLDYLIHSSSVRYVAF